MAYEKWGQPGDLRRKARYDSGGKDIGDQGFSPLELNLVRAMKELANQMPEMTPAQRKITMVIIGMMVVSLVSGCVSPGGAGPVTSIDQGDHQPVASATAIGAVPNVEPVYVDTPDTNIPAVDAPSAAATTQVVASAEATPKPPTPAVTKTPEIRIDAGGVMTPEEVAMFEQLDKSFLAQCEYWGNAPIPAVNLETCRNGSLIAHIMIDKEGGDMGVAYQAPGEKELYALPWGPNGPIQIPATGYVDGLPKKGAGPLRLTAEGFTADGVHYRLGWKNHRWVRADDTGKIIEQINDQGVWEAVRLQVELGMDFMNPVFVDWQDWQTAEFSSPGDGFGPDVVWDMAWGWDNPVNGTYTFSFGEEFGGPNPLYRDVNKRPIKMAGFFKTVTPEGNTIFMVRELVKNTNGSVTEWFFAMDLSNDSERVLSVLADTYTDQDTLLLPQALLTEDALQRCKQKPAFGEEICEFADTNPRDKMEVLVETGNWPDDGKRHVYIPSGGRWIW